MEYTSKQPIGSAGATDATPDSALSYIPHDQKQQHFASSGNGYILKVIVQNTFIHVPDGTDRTVRVRSHSAPPSASYEDAKAIEEPIASCANDSDQGSTAPSTSQAETPVVSPKPKRPCQSKRLRYEKFKRGLEEQIQNNPDLDIYAVRMPSFLTSNEPLRMQLIAGLALFKQEVQARRSSYAPHGVCGHPPAANERLQVGGAHKQAPSRPWCGSHRSHAWWASPVVAGGWGSNGQRLESVGLGAGMVAAPHAVR
mmetsp:Transcript_18203/g.49435  ORF Transcript_18203/g.49435 Transcript_18203/m.49435 type:complete len:255 (-) Transcript_18203:193-957(-)